MDEIIKELEKILYANELDKLFDNPMEQLDNIFNSLGF